MDGWVGSVLRVNLTQGSITKEPLDLELAQQYIGGRGLAVRFLTDEMDASIDPLAPESKQIFAGGLLTGTFAPSSGRFNIVAKGPLSGTLTASSCGGSFGAQLKYAGYDLLIIEGRAKTPVYLSINDDQVKIIAAQELWGKDIPETTEFVRKAIGESASVVCIGPAGENLVYFANIVNDLLYPDGHTGSGAVMGSKNLKAIAVRGSGAVTMADRIGFRKAVIAARNQIFSGGFSGKTLGAGATMQFMDVLNGAGALPARNFQDNTFPQVGKIKGEVFSSRYFVRPFACFACIIGCRQFSRISCAQNDILSAGPDLAAAWALGPDCGIGELGSIIRANSECNRLGLDAASMGAVLACAMELSENNFITKKESRVDLHFDNKGLLPEMIQKTAMRQDFGEQMAQGSYRLAERFGHAEVSMSIKKQEMTACDPRVFPEVALDYATSNWGDAHLLAAITTSSLADGSRKKVVNSQSDDVQRVIDFQNRAAVLDSSGLCIYTQLSIGMEEVGALLSPLTGVNYDANRLVTAGERIWNQERTWNSKAGLLNSDDRLPERLSEGFSVDMLNEYYQKRGWAENQPG